MNCYVNKYRNFLSTFSTHSVILFFLLNKFSNNGTKKWDLLWATDSLKDHQIFRATLPKNSITSTNKNVPCYAGKCKGDHNMTLRYMQCMAKECANCLVCYRTIDCETSSSYYAYQKLATRHDCENFNDKDFCNKGQWQRGVPVDVKSAIMHLMFEKDISKPFRIHMHLQKQLEKRKISSLSKKLSYIDKYLSFTG
jgi:hypothetical protein